MKKMSLGLIASIMLLPVISFAQTTPQPPSSWISFQQEENAKRNAFFQQMRADQTAFLSSHPEVKTYLDELSASNKARMAAWRAAHPKLKP